MFYNSTRSIRSRHVLGCMHMQLIDDVCLYVYAFTYTGCSVTMIMSCHVLLRWHRTECDALIALFLWPAGFIWSCLCAAPSAWCSHPLLCLACFHRAGCRYELLHVDSMTTLVAVKHHCNDSSIYTSLLQRQPAQANRSSERMNPINTMNSSLSSLMRCDATECNGELCKARRNKTAIAALPAKSHLCA